MRLRFRNAAQPNGLIAKANCASAITKPTPPEFHKDLCHGDIQFFHISLLIIKMVLKLLDMK